MIVGLNLYSIRNKIQTEEEFLATAKTLKEYGYKYMQFSGSPLKADAVARVSKESGMPVYLTHMPYDRIVNDTEALMEEHASFGCKNIGLGMMPTYARLDVEKCKETVAKLNAVGEKMQRNGFTFFYHNHHVEFVKLFGNQTIMDYMIENAPYIHFTADTYWLQYGGVNVLEYLEKMKGRIACVHLKDYQQVLDEKNWPAPKFAPCGDGLMNFPVIVEKAKECGAKYFFVEQDNAADLPDTMEQVKRSVDYLKEI